MHDFADLAYRSMNFMMMKLAELQQIVISELSKNGSTSAVKNLQMIELHKSIMAVGVFSMFEASIQDRFGSRRQTFTALCDLLEKSGERDLLERLNWYILAINVLKHGVGRSYSELSAISDDVPFRVKLKGEDFFDEGDVSEIDTLVQVDEKFIIGCIDVIKDATEVIRQSHPAFLRG